MLSPDEIRVKEFLPSLRGYDADEVRAFLLAIADTVDTLQAQIGRTPDRVVETTRPVASDPELSSRVTRLSEELELAIWTMRRLESAVIRLEDRLESDGSSSFLAS